MNKKRREKSTNPKWYDPVVFWEISELFHTYLHFKRCLLSLKISMPKAYSEHLRLWSVWLHLFMHVAYEEVKNFIDYCPLFVNLATFKKGWRVISIHLSFSNISVPRVGRLWSYRYLPLTPTLWGRLCFIPSSDNVSSITCISALFVHSSDKSSANELLCYEK